MKAAPMIKRAEIGRQLAALPGGGEVVKGFGDIEQANYRAVVNHARGFLAKGDVKGAMGVYNQYDNGEDGEVLPRGPVAVELSDVDFAYPGGPPVLTDVTWRVEPRSCPLTRW